MSGARGMQRRRLGRSAVSLSVVGFGTAQLRMVPEAQALASLRRGFELGVDWIHASPDYCGAEELVARAVREAGLGWARIDGQGSGVVVASDGSGEMPHFEHLFERAARTFGIEGKLALWGISCIDDQEFVGHDVWGERGMVSFLEARKREGRLGAAYCTTHGPPDYVESLITCGAFDAVMLAYNPLGFHVLSSYAASEGKFYEDLAENRRRIFGLAREHGVSLLVMKPFAGGLLGASQAFPPRGEVLLDRTRIAAHEVLRAILAEPAVAAVVPGTACVAEAEENALAGHEPLTLAPSRARALQERVERLRERICSRCGACEPTCSRGLPISWLFRDAYVWSNPGDSFDAVPRLHYFHLHPEHELACATCDDRTCFCPQGLDVPVELARVHETMLGLRARGLLPRTPEELERAAPLSSFAARVVLVEMPRELARGGSAIGRVWLENAGERVWTRADAEASGEASPELEVRRGEALVERVTLRDEVAPGARTHFAFEVRAEHDAEWTLAIACAASGESVELARARVELAREGSWSRLVGRVRARISARARRTIGGASAAAKHGKETG